MLLPPGHDSVQELNTSYTIFEHLLANLTENRFNGYLQLIFWGYEGILVYDTGKIIQAFSSDPDLNLSGPTAVYRMIQKARQKEGNIRLNPLSNELSLVLGIAVTAASSSDIRKMAGKSLAEIMDSLRREELTGYIDLVFEEGAGRGTIFLLDGNPMESVIQSPGGKIVSGEAVLRKFQSLAKKLHPVMTVHGTKHADLIAEDVEFIIPWKHRAETEFWEKFFAYLASVFNEKMLREPFYRTLQRLAAGLGERHPLLHPKNGVIEVSPSAFRIKKLARRSRYNEAITALLGQLWQSVPSRKRRKIRIDAMINHMAKLSKSLDESPPLQEYQTILTRAFSGKNR